MSEWLTGVTMVLVYDAFVVLLLLSFIVLCFLRRGGVAFLTLIAAVFCACFSNLDHIAKFQASIDSLQVTMNEANNTIEQLQRMAGLLGEAILDDDRFAGVLGGVPGEVTNAHRKAIARILEDVQAGPDVTEGVLHAEHTADADTMIGKVYTAASNTLPWAGPLNRNAFTAAFNSSYDPDYQADKLLPPTEFDALFREFKVTDPRAVAALDAYRRFYGAPDEVSH